ncbi:MAG: PAS domain S-box protein [Alphaproteobacteria bacterium]|nr:PAS domain S-box protein [Alphaproteobacteria bacterium]
MSGVDKPADGRPELRAARAGALIVALVAAGLVGVLIDARQRSLANYQNRLDRVAAVAAARIGVALTNASILLDRAAENNAQDGHADAHMHALLQNLVAGRDLVRAIDVFHADGTLDHTSRILRAPPASVAERPFFQAFSRGSATGVFISERQVDPHDGWASFVIARALPFKEAGFAGVVAATMSADDVVRAFGSVAPRGAQLVLSRATGEVLAVRDDDAWASSRDAADRLHATAPVERYGLRVAADIAVPTALEAWRRYALNIATGGAIILIAVAALLSLMARQARRMRRAGEQARLQADLLRDAIESISGAVTLFDAEERLVLWNAAFSDHFARHGATVRAGMTYGELLQLALDANAAPEGAAGSEWIAESLARFRNPPGMVEQRDPDGRWHLTTERRTSDGGVIAIRADITALRAQQEATRALADRLQLATKSAGIGVWDVEIATGHVIWNAEMFRIFGVEPGSDDLVRAFLAALHPDDLETYIEDRNAALHGDRELLGEYRLLRRNGAVAAVRLSGTVHRDGGGRPLRVVGTALDITERRILEEQRRLALDAFDGVVFMTDSAQRIVITNERLRVLVPDADRSTWLGAPVSDLFACVARAGLVTDAVGREEAWVAERLDRHANPRGRFEVERPDGIWLLMSDTKLRSGGTITVGTDITALKRSEQALRDSEARFRSFAESASDWYWEQDENLRFTYLSPGQGGSFRTPQASLGKTRREIGPLDVEAAAWEAHEADLAARRPFRDFRYARLDASGRKRLVSVSGQPWFDATGRFRGYRGVGRDITEAVERERAIGETQRRFLDALEAIDVAIALWDADDRLVVCNSSYLRLAGPSADYLRRGVSFEEYVRRYVASGAADVDGATEEQFVSWRMDRHRDPQASFQIKYAGSWLMLVERRTPDGGTVTTAADIGEIKSREAALEATSAALAESQARLNAVFETVGDAIIVIEEDGTIVAANGATQRLLGYGIDELVGQSVESLMPQPHSSLHGGYIERFLRTGEAQIIGKGRKMRGRRKDGGEVPLFVSVSEMRVNDRRYFTGVLHDLTEAVEAEEQKLLLESRLKQSERLSVIGLLTGGVAHEINNVLTPILLFARLMKDDLPAESAAQADLDKVIQAALRGQQIVKSLRSQARSEERQDSRVDIDKVVQEATALVRPMLKPGVRLDVAPAVGSRHALGDETQLVQSVVNLVLNANEAMLRDGGRIAVAIERIEVAAGRPRLLDKMEDGPAWAICVEDTGRGMDAATLDRVAQPYFSTKEKSGNSGLGLSIVRDIMRGHKGGLSIESAQGRGTTVRLVIPILAEPTSASTEFASARANAGPPVPQAGRGAQVLVVDDEPEVFEALMSALRRSGFDPVGSTRASEALAIVGAPGSHVAAAVIDLAMPEMPGQVLARRLRTLSPGLPILVVTARRSAYDDEELKAVGVRGILDKPVLPAELAGAVATMLSGSVAAGRA